MDETTPPIIKYSSYTPAQKRATQKYRENNKDKVNEQRKQYYKNRKERDPDFLEYKRDKAKQYYQIKKQHKLLNIDIETPIPIEPEPVPEPEIVSDTLPETLPEIVPEPIQVLVPEMVKIKGKIMKK